MAQIRPQIKMRYGRVNEPVRAPVQDIMLYPVVQTFLLTNTTSGLSTLNVKTVYGFAQNQVLAIGDDGNQASEIVKTHATTAPSGNTITLTTGLARAHSAGNWVKLLPYDQIEFSHATTLTGSKTVLLLTQIAIGLSENRYNDTTNTSGFYFARYKNSISGTFSSYSDGAPYTGYTILTARSVIDAALGMINKQTSEVLSDDFFFTEINNCQMEVLREFKRWSFMQKFDHIVTKTVNGVWKIDVPTDLDDQNTNKSLYKFRIGKEPNMIWVDKEDWNNLISGIAYSTVLTRTTAGLSILTLDSSSDFDATGSVKVRGDSIEYSANNEGTGTLTLSSALTTTLAAGTDVFQHASFGNPLYWTIYDGVIRHYPPVSSSYEGRNYYLDYYKKLTSIVTDSDEIVLPDPTVVQYYLAWKALMKLANGDNTPAAQSMMGLYLARREQMKKKESMNREFLLMPPGYADSDGDRYY